MARYHALTRDWTLEAVSGPVPDSVRGARVPATVPGVVHTDLLAAGLIPDPYLDDNESRLGWIGRASWRYSTSFRFPADPGERHDLVCEGLDTLATVELNGTVVGTTANQHRSYRFDVTGLLRDGDNELTVTFASALDHAERVAEREPRPHTNHHPYNAVRKMACNFGWDWGPDLVTAGIWRPIGIRAWRAARLAGVRPLVTEASAESGTVTFHADLEGDCDGLTATFRAGPGTVTIVLPPGADRVVAPVTVEKPALWWPRGYGEQPLYDAEVTLGAPGEEPLDSWSGRVGFRTVEVDTRDAGGTGSPFILRVNGQDVFVRGANWIPDDAFPSRVDRARYARRLDDATGAGINLLRVWGGGIYESDDFYDLCAERGVLVWQDFLFACAAYAEEELAEEVEAEARQAVARLSRHASLALWNGNNENLWGFADWNWRPRLAGRSWGESFYYELLPRIVAEIDPTRPYIPGSPFSPDRADHPNDPSTGLVHIWDVWNEKDYRVYAEYTPRFVAEFGFQGPPTWATLTEAIHGERLAPTSPVMLAHQKARDGIGKLERGWRGHFPDPDGLADWHWTTQLNQARAVAFGIERFRSLAPYCRGTVVWQLNDCWPVVSWAAVDGYGRRKPLWYALRRVYADRLVTVRREPGRVVLTAINDSPEPWSGTLRARRVAFDGTELAAASFAVDLPARSNSGWDLPAEVAVPGDEKAELIAVDGAAATRWFFAEDVRLALPEPRLTGTLTRVEGGYEVEIEAGSLLRDLTLHADRLDPAAVVDDQLVTLLPGERARFTVTTSAELSAAAVLSSPVLRTANDLSAR